jgi:hypothetical protein
LNRCRSFSRQIPQTASIISREYREERPQMQVFRN